jgi:beta-lactamase regulating signal transducer with metallopeptidase domain
VAVTAVYFVGVALLVGRLLFERSALRRLARRSREISDAGWRRALTEAAGQLRLATDLRLLRCAGEIVPITFGFRTPVIVVPPSSDDWSDDRRRAVLLHELAHVARRDCLTQLLGAVACAVYWPHPGVWLAARRLRVERELACDDRVLAAGAEPGAYAGHLLELAHSLRPASALATAMAMARPRDLEHRLLAIVDAARDRGALPRGRSAILAAAFVALLLPMAALRADVVDVPLTRSQPEQTAQPAQDASAAWAREAGAALRVELARNGYANPDNQGLVRAAQHGVNAEYVRQMAAVGYRVGTLDALVGLRDHGIDPEYVRGMAALGFARLSTDDLLHARDHGIEPEYVGGMRDLGYPATLEVLLRMRSHGVEPEYIRGLAALGYKGLPLDTLVRMRSQGVDPEYIRRVQAKGLGPLTPEQLIDRRARGLDEPGVAAREMYAALQSLWRSLIGR